MGMKFACLTALLVLVGVGLISCGTSSSTPVAGTGYLYVTTQGNASVSVWGIDLGTGVITTNNNATATGNMPVAVVLAPSGNAAFVANKQDNTISAYTVNSDATLTVSGSAVTTGESPVALAIDPGGNFLYVANQGNFGDPTSGTISVFAIQGTTLTPSGSLSTATPGVTTGTGPVSLAITSNGDYLYVANQFTNTVSGYSINAGVLTLVPGSPYPVALAPAVGITPTAVTLTPDGNILFVANGGSNNISGFMACTSTTLNCITPDGHLTPSPNSPYSAGLDPVSMAVESDSQGEYLYVADYNSSQVSEYKVAIQTGVLTALSTPAISTGANPSAVVVRAGTGTLLSTGGTSYFVFTSNASAGTISSFTYDSTFGVLGLIGSGSPATTAGQPSAMAVR